MPNRRDIQEPAKMNVQGSQMRIHSIDACTSGLYVPSSSKVVRSCGPRCVTKDQATGLHHDQISYMPRASYCGRCWLVSHTWAPTENYIGNAHVRRRTTLWLPRRDVHTSMILCTCMHEKLSTLVPAGGPGRKINCAGSLEQKVSCVASNNVRTPDGHFFFSLIG